MSNSDSPANPTQYMDYSNGSGELYCDNNGLTKREAFAMAAMQGLLANGIPDSKSFVVPQDEYEMLAAASVLQADALLKELSK